MDRTAMSAARSRAKMQIQTHGGRVTGWHRHLPVVYALPPLNGPVWPVSEVLEVSDGVRQMTRTSYIGGCTVIWS
ncbi:MULTISPECIES: hypothetical protein [Hafnia]|uniref:hypothetical protein n=1 Tax=Hafnia TaxID=568 RepID=UPI0008FEF5CC|nr:hypothetical protein [Hafnia alvei]QQE44170.1 hypothetical protein I6H95_02295 [Hafnia alvei]